MDDVSATLVVVMVVDPGRIEAVCKALAEVPEGDSTVVLLWSTDPQELDHAAQQLLRTGLAVREAGVLRAGVTPVAQPSVVQRAGDLLELLPCTVAPELALDRFLISVAKAVREAAVVVFAPDASHPMSIGARAVHGEGGSIVLCPTRDDGSPVDVVVDRVVSMEEVPSVLSTLGALHLQRGAEDEASMTKIIGLLGQSGELQPEMYKPAMLRRRVERRRKVAGSSTLSGYATHLAEHAPELERLRHDLFIGVTEFFRDPQVWQLVRRAVLEPAARMLAKGDQLRCWVAACSTGEEAYSIAMLALDVVDGLGLDLTVKVFATDIDRRSIEVASAGWYSTAALVALTPTQRRRWFVVEGDGYRVRPRLREALVFAPHDLTRDAPFTRMSLVSCRNVLMYLRPKAQRLVLRRLHFALNRGGGMVLGSAETPAAISGGLEVLDSTCRVYRRSGDIGGISELGIPVRQGRTRRDDGTNRYDRVAYSAELRRRGAGALFIDERHQIFRTIGAVERFMQVQEGVPSQELRALLQPSVALPIGAGLHRARSTRREVSYRRVAGADHRGDTRLDIRVRYHPVEDGRNAFFSVLIEPSASLLTEHLEGEQADDQVRYLQHELELSQANLAAIIEELEVANEHVGSTSEELMAANEELQSTNEELHSVNEELFSVNLEHQARLGEMMALQSTLEAIVGSAGVGALLVDESTRIRQFTDTLRGVIPLTSADIGRPIRDLAHGLADVDVAADIAAVIESGVAVERETTTTTGRRVLQRVTRFQRKADQRHGAVLTILPLRNDEAMDDVALVQRLQAATGLQHLGSFLGVQAPDFMDEALTALWTDAHMAQLQAAIQRSSPDRSLLHDVVLGGWECRFVGVMSGPGLLTRGFVLGRPVLDAVQQPEPLTAAGIAVVMVDDDGRVMRMNDAFAGYVGADPLRVRGLRLVEVDDRLSEVVALLESADHQRGRFHVRRRPNPVDPRRSCFVVSMAV